MRALKPFSLFPEPTLPGQGLASAVSCRGALNIPRVANRRLLVPEWCMQSLLRLLSCKTSSALGGASSFSILRVLFGT